MCYTCLYCHGSFLGKPFTSNYSDSGNYSDGDSPVFSFPIAHNDHPEIQFGLSSISDVATPPCAKDEASKFLNVNANEFVPLNRSVIKRGDETIPHLSNHATSIPPPLSHPPLPAMYYQYYPQWVTDPRIVQPAFFPHFGHHGYRYPYPSPPPHPLSVPQVAVVAPYRTTGDIRPSIRISEEKLLRGNEYSMPDTPKYQASPFSPNSLPSPPSTHGDSGIDLGQSKSVSPPITIVIQPLPARPSSVNEVINYVPVDKETTPEDVSIGETTPTHQTTISKTDITTNDKVTLLNSIPVNINETQSVCNIEQELETTPTIKTEATPTNEVSVLSVQCKNLTPSSQEDKVQTTPINTDPIKPTPLNISHLKSVKITPKNSANIIINSDNTKTTPTGNEESKVLPVSSNTVTPTTDTHKTTIATPTIAAPTMSVKSWASIVGKNNNNITKNKTQKINPTEQPVKDVTVEPLDTISVTEPLTEEAKRRLKLLGGKPLLLYLIN